MKPSLLKGCAVRVLRGPHRGIAGVLLDGTDKYGDPTGVLATISPDGTDGAELPIEVLFADLGERIKVPTGATGTIIDQGRDGAKVLWDGSEPMDDWKSSWVHGGSVRKLR